MRERLSRYRRGAASIEEVLTVAWRMTSHPQEVITRIGSPTSFAREGMGSRHGEEAEDEETEGEVDGDVVNSLPIELPGKRRQTLSTIFLLYP